MLSLLTIAIQAAVLYAFALIVVMLLCVRNFLVLL